LTSSKGWFSESLAEKDSVKLRAAGYLCLDYYKCIMDVGIVLAGLPFNEGLNIPTKFRMLRDRHPGLEPWAAVIGKVERFRQKIHHTELTVVRPGTVRSLLDSAAEFSKSVEEEVARRNKGLTYVVLVDEELSAIETDLHRLSGMISQYKVPEIVGRESLDPLMDLYYTLEPLTERAKRNDPESLPALWGVLQFCSAHVSRKLSEFENEWYFLAEQARIDEEDQDEDIDELGH
jgi:hypothetical protein